MRTYEEIVEMVKNPRSLMKCDLYGVGIVELYPFVEVDDIPKLHREKLDKDVAKNWNPNEERDNFNFQYDLNDELSYCEKLVNNDEINAAIFATPRALSLIWLNGDSINDYDKEIINIIEKHVSLKSAKQHLKRIYKRIRTEYNI